MEPQTPTTNQTVPISTSTPQTQPVSTPSPMPSSGKKRRIPKWLKIILIVILCLAIFFVVVFFAVGSATKAPQKISDQFINDVQSSDTSAAYALTSSGFQGATSQDQLDALIKQVSPLVQGQEKITGRTIAKSTGVPTTAVFVYTVSTPGGTKYMKTELQKNNGTWQIINFRPNDTPLNTNVE